jgi:hypothetical protein
MSEINNDISQVPQAPLVPQVNELTNISQEIKTTPFDFIKDPEKLKILIRANELLNIDKTNHSRLIFVYSAPKVGSTSIVSSLRIFGSDKVDIIHIHDEEMLRVLAHIQNITVNELILFNKYLGKNIYVINVYRSPIERKISTFFEKIGSYHFNDEDAKVNTYNVIKVINRFNNIFPYIGLGDHFIDNYNINYPDKFDNLNKYLLVKENDISYITLRLTDSDIWGNILTNIFGFNIHIIKDYESNKKPIKDLYIQFKMNYKIPKNLLNDIAKCKYLNYYYTQEEISSYYNEWYNKSTLERDSYTLEQYNLYQEITIENSHFDHVQFDHYMDEGCVCNACKLKRAEMASKIMRNIHISDRLVHTEARIEFLEKRVVQVNRINQVIHNISKKVRGKDFKKDMSNIVRGKRI